MNKMHRRFNPGEVNVESNAKIVTLRFPLNQISKLLTRWDGKKFYERLQPTIFDEDLKNKERIITVDVNHDMGGIPLARRKGGEGTLRMDRKGDWLIGEFDMPNFASGVMESMQRGDMDGVSIAFMNSPEDEKWGEHKGFAMRDVVRGTIHAMTITYNGAYADGNLGYRSMCLNNKEEMTSEDYEKAYDEMFTRYGGTPSEARDDAGLLAQEIHLLGLTHPPTS